ncbi:MAG: glycoside hydrolase family 43 protein [Clostridia bacterium]|nr:glycoside hydrolase family 43 protein [Clostridia bacterium]
MQKLMKRAAALILCLWVLPAGVFGEAREGEDYSVSFEGIKTGIVNARTAVHDPSIIAADGRYYIFGSHMTAASSENLRGWDRIGNGYSPDNRVWGNLFAEGSHVFDWAGSSSSTVPTDDGAVHVWAPDVIWNPVMGKYMMYYCTSSTWNASSICFGLSDTIEGPYEWQATLICSGFDKTNIDRTNVSEYVDEDWAKTYFTLAGGYNYQNWPNAIDPGLFFDADGRFWMVYGSWSGGIFLLELDPATGLVIHPEADKANRVDPYFGRHLFGGNHQSMEGPYVQYDPEAGYYYLFVSYGGLSAHGGYQIRVFRSETPEGPYLDMNGEQPNRRGGHANFGLKLSGNYNLPSLRQAYMATGHNSALIDGDGRRYVCFHSRFNNGTESFQPIVKQYALNAEGWPCVLPFATRGETLEDAWTAEDVAGRWFVINQGTEINDVIAEPVIRYLRTDGSVGAAEGDAGTWALREGSHFVTLTLDGVTYSGVVCRMQDEGGTPVTVFSAVGENMSVWGVKYEE